MVGSVVFKTKFGVMRLCLALVIIVSDNVFSRLTGCNLPGVKVGFCGFKLRVFGYKYTAAIKPQSCSTFLLSFGVAGRDSIN